MTRQVVLYTRPRCGLCDEAREVLLSVRDEEPFELLEVDIEGDEDLELEYGIRIPVIELDGRELFELSVEKEAILAALRG
jgi:glutaredoxin